MANIARAFLVVGGVSMGGILTGAYLTRTAIAAGSDPYKDLDTLAQALHHIEAQYLGTTTTRDLVYGAIDGMMDKLDTHSVFLDPEAMASAQIRTEGIYSGVGIELKTIDDSITVIRTVPTSPADGVLEQGDRLLQIGDQKPTNLLDASKLLQGSPGTQVTITVNRKGQSMVHKLTRERLRDRTVRISDLGKGWALAEISRFQRNTASDLQQGLEKVAPNTGVIIDLRGNAGGLLDEAVDVVDLFAKRGLIVETRGPNEVMLESHQARAGAPFGSLQTIILTDGESASASEIVAGAMRSLAGSKLVGTPTYGKWSVQRMYVFEDESAIKLTVARYHIADTQAGTDLVGLQPDVHVERTTAHLETINRLLAITEGNAEAELLLNRLAKNEGDSVAVPHLGPLSERLTLDPQLAAAWTLAQNNH